MFDGNFKTSFMVDFSIAECFGMDAIKDTFNRAFNEWKNNYEYLTELVIVLNWKIWEWYEKNEEVARLYNDLWEKADGYACDTLEGEQAEYFFNMTD